MERLQSETDLTMRRRTAFAGALVVAASLFAAAEACAATISDSWVAGPPEARTDAMPLFSHERSIGLALLPEALVVAAAEEPRSLTGIELVDDRESGGVEAAAAGDEVAPTFKAEHTYVVAAARSLPSPESAPHSTFRVLPAKAWSARQVDERDITNIESRPIRADAADEGVFAGSVIAPIARVPQPPANARVNATIEPVVMTGVAALNVVLSAAISLFEQVSSALHRILTVG